MHELLFCEEKYIEDYIFSKLEIFLNFIVLFISFLVQFLFLLAVLETLV